MFKGYNLHSKDKPNIAIKIMVIKNECKIFVDVETLKLYRQEALRQQLVKSEGIVKVHMSKILEIGKEKVFVIAYELMNGG